MTEPESTMQVREESARGKGGKGKAIIRRSKTETPSRQQDAPAETRRSESRQPVPETPVAEDRRDPEILAKIQQRAYGLFEERGREHGHDLEHWLEAERQITGSSKRADRER